MGVQSDSYWSGTSDAEGSNIAWYVGLGSGFVYSYSKTQYFFYVWPVRGPVSSQPTLIELSSLKASPLNQKVKLEWMTETEIDNAGFNVWRAEGFTKISPALIPSQGSPTGGAVYNYLDELLSNGKPYFYLIEDVDTNGISTFHGPVKAVPRLLYGLGR